MKSFSELKSDLTAICEAFKLGPLISYITKDHNAQGYKIAEFQTESGQYQYIFKN